MVVASGVLRHVNSRTAESTFERVKCMMFDAQVEDFKAVTLKAMETQDADNQALEERLHKRMAKCVGAAVESPKQMRSHFAGL